MKPYQSRTMNAITISIVSMIGALLIAIGVVTNSAMGDTPKPIVEAEPEFHYGDCVLVVGGFYRGCRGLVYQQRYNNIFEVNVTCKRGEQVLDRFSASVLSLQKDSFCRSKK